MAAMMTMKPTSERISIILRPKRSARRPKTGDRMPETAGVTADSAPTRGRSSPGSVTPSSRT